MEKPKKQKSTLLKFLCPGRDQHRSSTKLKPQPYKGFSGPMMSNQPGFDAHEPTSPKVSCMGQVKCKKITTKKSPPPCDHDHSNSKQVKRRSSAITRLFSRSEINEKDYKKNEKVGTLGDMRMFASGRESLANFDWTAQMDHDHRDCYSDGEGVLGEKEIIIAYSAPMLVGGEGLGFEIEPKKEINIWKRRTLTPPSPLTLMN